MSDILNGVSQAEINSNYILRQVQLLKTNDSDLVGFDPTPDNLSVPASQITLTGNPAPVDTVALGTELSIDTSNQVTLIGHGVTVQESNDCISIGGSSGQNPNIIRNAPSSINIGHDNPMGGATVEQGAFNIVIGSVNPKGINGAGNRNVLIGNALNSGDQTSNQIIISHKPLNASPVTGAIVFGGGAHAPAADARVQFLSEDILNVGGAVNVAAVDNGAGGWNVPFPATMRIRYKGVNYQIPLLADP